MRYLLLALTLLTPSLCLAADEFQELFNGKDLAGWDADKKIWSVQDGLLTGETTADSKLAHNTFAIWQADKKDGEVGDFELEAVFRLEGDNNSGVQYRSARLPKNGPWAVAGYQADIHPAANWAGMLYDEGGRGILAERGQKLIVAEDGAKDVSKLPGEVPTEDFSKWNTLTVSAIGNHLVHKLNDKVTVDITDNESKNAESHGIIALQVHAGPPMKVQYKSVRLKKLGDEKPKKAK